MADIILKDIYGNDQTYRGVEKVKLKTSDGGTQIFSKGETVENVPIAIDFSEGDQAIYADDGYLVKSAILQKPADLKPENIVKGATIAGIPGEYEGGGEANEGNIENDIFPLRAVSGFRGSILPDTYCVELTPAFSINEGETYYVEWEGTTYKCKAYAKQNGAGTNHYVCLGEFSDMGFVGNGEPFLIMLGIEEEMVSVYAVDNTNESHEIRIYQKCHIPLGYELKEIVSEKPLTFAVGNSSQMPNTPAVTLAEENYTDMINNGESVLVIWDGALYAVYAGERTTPNITFPAFTSTMSVDGAVGNIGIPSVWSTGTVEGTAVADTKKFGKSNEPFLIIANTSHGFQVAIPEDSTTLTHTLQIFKFVR